MRSTDSYRTDIIWVSDIIFWNQSLIEKARCKADFQDIAKNLDSFLKIMGKES